jgi:hypothetical protein
LRGLALPVILSRVNRRGKFGSCPVNWSPGVAASSELLPSGQEEKR